MAVRLTGQAADGAFQAGLASLFFFSPERQATPAAVAFAAARPAAAVHRRRAVGGGAAGPPSAPLGARVRQPAARRGRAGGRGGAGRGSSDVVVGVLALVVLSVNRALLAGLSAALPHVVTPDRFVLANSVTPTAGTVAAAAGATATVAVTASLGTGSGADVGALVVAALAYAASGSSPSPSQDPAGPTARARSAARRSVRDSAADVVAGVRHLRERVPAAAALGLIAWHRWSFGLTTVAMVVLCRRVLAAEDDPSAGLAALGVLLAAVAVGAGWRPCSRRGAPAAAGCTAGSRGACCWPGSGRRAGPDDVAAVADRGRGCWGWAVRAPRSASTRSCSAASTTPTAAGCSRPTTSSSTSATAWPARPRSCSSPPTAARAVAVVLGLGYVGCALLQGRGRSRVTV